MDLFKQCQQWFEQDEAQKVIDALEAIPAEERTPELDSELAKAYIAIAEIGEAGRALYEKALELLEPHEEEGQRQALPQEDTIRQGARGPDAPHRPSRRHPGCALLRLECRYPVFRQLIRTYSDDRECRCRQHRRFRIRMHECIPADFNEFHGTECRGPKVRQGQQHYQAVSSLCVCHWYFPQCPDIRIRSATARNIYYG